MPIPKYAQNADRSKLVQFLCKTGCRKMRYGEVSKYPFNTGKLGIDTEIYVTCLKCNGIQHDKSNWYKI